MTKSELRSLYLERRRALSDEDVRVKSAAILERLLALPVVQQATEVLTYVSSMDNEVDTLALIARLLEEHRRVLVPVCAPGRTLRWSQLDTLDDLSPTRFGVLEPSTEHLLLRTPSPTAVVIVPGIAFTRDGYRIGYGAGYYDRFLAQHPGPTIGLAYDISLVGTIPTEPHDIPVDLVVTETEDYRCG